MTGFDFCSPTRFVFGEDSEKSAGELLKGYGAKKALIHYGGGSAERSGLLKRIRDSLSAAGISYCELGGVSPNPRVELAREGIELCKEQGVDFILAVGGGSVIDSSKCIAMGVYYDGDVWDFYAGRAKVQKALPVGVVLTISAAGSEGSPNSVITNRKEGLKSGSASDLLRPVFAILNPEITATLPAYQTAAGAADMFVHVVERYFTPTKDVYLTDLMCEAVMKTIVKFAPRAVHDKGDKDARAQIMWSGTLAHNNILGVGRVQDWSSHGLQAIIGAVYDSTHGAGLAAVCPAWMSYVYKNDVARFVRYSVEVFGVENDVFHPEEVAEEGIRRTKEFFRSLGMPVTLKELGVPEGDIPMLARRLKQSRGKLGGFVLLDEADYVNIFNLAC